MIEGPCDAAAAGHGRSRTFTFHNQRPIDLLLWLEPWAEEFSVPPGSKLELVVKGNVENEADAPFELWDTHLTFYARADTLVQVLIDGRKLPSASSDVPFPGGSVHLETRTIVEEVFGDFPETRPGGVGALADRIRAPMQEGDLRLEPLAETHREALKAACAEDREIWSIYSVSYGPDEFDESFDKIVARPNGQAFAIFSGDALAGMSAYLGIDPERQALEIGNTYYVPALRGTGFNRRVKDLMIGRAIDCGFRRIEFRVDSRNQRSQAALARIGAVREGVLRADRITWNGHVRDTVLFSILADEWRGADDPR